MVASWRRRLAWSLAAGWMLASAAQAQVVAAPTLDGPTLRARLAPADRPLPADAAALDRMVAEGRFTDLATRLSGTRDPQIGLLDLNWERARLFDGAGFIVAFSYLNDLWRMGAAVPEPAAAEMKQSAGMMFLYALALVRLDGTHCADVSAPGHRQDQLFAQNRPLIAYLRSLPAERRMTLGTIALAVEGATRSVRRDDPVLCSGGLDEIAAGLRAQGERPLPRGRSSGAGTTYPLPRAPGYAPAFVAPAAWQPKVAAARATLPAALTALLADEPPAKR